MTEGRDYIGDQIGWAVRQIMPPTPDLKRIDRAIMKALPRPLARVVALIRVNKGWLPETDHPDRLFNSLSESLGQIYITKYGPAHKANTLIMPTTGDPLRVHTASFGENQREIPLRWDKQVQWALTFQDRMAHEGQALEDERVEALTIIKIQSKLNGVLEITKQDFINRGLPLPDVTQIENHK